jgi:serine/threonine protein kinase
MPTVALGDKKSVTFGARVAEGDLCNLYQGTYKDENPAPKARVKHAGPRTRFDHILEDDDDDLIEVPVIVKICNDPGNNDLLIRESQVLSGLTSTDPDQSKFNLYYPTCYGGFDSRGQRGNILSLVTDCFSVADILKAFPNGIDYRDMAWMFKRTLVGLWWAHKRGFLHGAVLPPHILLLGQNHGAKIIDWCYSVSTRELALENTPRRSRPVGEPDPTDSIYANMTRIHVLLTEYADYYPPEVPNREEASEATDIYMAAKCMVALLGGDVKTNKMPDSVPREIQNLLVLCLNPQRRMRPSKADDVHEAFDNLLKSIVGKPTFRPFELPGR